MTDRISYRDARKKALEWLNTRREMFIPWAGSSRVYVQILKRKIDGSFLASIGFDCNGEYMWLAKVTFKNDGTALSVRCRDESIAA